MNDTPLDDPDAPSVYVRDDGVVGEVVVYRASDLGGCLTRLAAARQGQDREPLRGQAVEVFGAGKDAEEEHIKRAGDIGPGQRVVLKVTKKIWVIGHTDGVWGGENGIPVEVKSQSDDEWERISKGPIPWDTDRLWGKYKWQISAYAVGLGVESVLLDRVRRSDGESERTMWARDQLYGIEEIRERVFTVEGIARQEEELVCLSPEWFCQYPQLHPEAEMIEDDDLEELVGRYLAIRTKRDHEAGRLEKIRKLIEERLDVIGSQKVMLMSGRSVSRAEYETKEHLVKASKQVRVTVTEVKGKREREGGRG